MGNIFPSELINNWQISPKTKKLVAQLFKNLTYCQHGHCSVTIINKGIVIPFFETVSNPSMSHKIKTCIGQSTGDGNCTPVLQVVHVNGSHILFDAKKIVVYKDVDQKNKLCL